jgi:nitroreductase
MSDNNKFTVLAFVPPTPGELLESSTGFRHALQTRRSVRSFSDRPVDRSVVENLIMSASSAPSGANKQPWHFCAVSASPMNFLQDILQRPSNEKPFLLLPVGYPAEGVKVPELKRKSAEEVITYY